MSTHYVVLHDGVSFRAGGANYRGDVIPRSMVEEDIERLLKLEAVREATEDEAQFNHITLPDQLSQAGSLEQRLAEQQRQITALLNSNSEMSDRVEKLLAEARTKEKREGGNPEVPEFRKGLTERTTLAVGDGPDRSNLTSDLRVPSGGGQEQVRDVGIGAKSSETRAATATQEPLADQPEGVKPIEGSAKPAITDDVEEVDDEKLPADFPARAQLVKYFGQDVTVTEIMNLSDDELKAANGVSDGFVAKIRAWSPDKEEA